MRCLSVFSLLYLCLIFLRRVLSQHANLTRHMRMTKSRLLLEWCFCPASLVFFLCSLSSCFFKGSGSLLLSIFLIANHIERAGFWMNKPTMRKTEEKGTVALIFFSEINCFYGTGCFLQWDLCFDSMPLSCLPSITNGQKDESFLSKLNHCTEWDCFYVLIRESPSFPFCCPVFAEKNATS